MMEGLFYGILAWLITVPLAYLFAKPVSAELGQVMLGIRLDYRFDFLSAVFWLGMVLVLAFLASYLPAKNAAKLTVREALAR